MISSLKKGYSEDRTFTPSCYMVCELLFKIIVFKLINILRNYVPVLTYFKFKFGPGIRIDPGLINLKGFI